jgi:hypothetical protein
MFPSLQKSPVATPTLAATELVSDIGCSGEAVVEHILNHTKRTTSVWVRQMHLVEPLDVLTGEYVLPVDGALPAPREQWQRALRKLNDPMNEAYTDAVFACMASRLAETGRSPHFCRFYGTFNGRVPEYWYNCTDDMADIEKESWFSKGLRDGTLQIMAHDAWDPSVCAPLTRPFENIQEKLDAVAEAQSLSDSENSASSSASAEGHDNASTLSDLVEADDVEANTDNAPVALRRPRVRLVTPGSAGSAASAGSHGSNGSDGSDDGDVIYKVRLTNFPVQSTYLERCDGTMDDLMEDEIDPDAPAFLAETKEARWTAWIFQVIAGLTTAQATYDFIHNDLHTNNVMWVGTGETHLYYHVQGAPGGDRIYKVPTYGRIMKIIDFGRATFRAPSAGTENRLWLPDAYAPGADAEGQYNCGNYFRQGEPKVLPNKSFDLCRLAVAILDTLWPHPEETPKAAQPFHPLTTEDGHTQAETVSPLWNLMWLWLTDQEGRNILRTPTGRERYPGFDLYCAIAQGAQNAVPAQQLTLPLFDSAFRCRRKDIPADTPVFKLQATHVAKKKGAE